MNDYRKERDALLARVEDAFERRKPGNDNNPYLGKERRKTRLLEILGLIKYSSHEEWR